LIPAPEVILPRFQEGGWIFSGAITSRQGLDWLQNFSTEVLHRFGGKTYTYKIAAVFLDARTPEA